MVQETEMWQGIRTRTSLRMTDATTMSNIKHRVGIPKSLSPSVYLEKYPQTMCRVQSWNQPERRPGRHQSSTVVEEETIEGMVSPEDHRSQESEGRRWSWGEETADLTRGGWRQARMSNIDTICTTSSSWKPSISFIHKRNRECDLYIYCDYNLHKYLMMEI